MSDVRGEVVTAGVPFATSRIVPRDKGEGLAFNSNGRLFIGYASALVHRLFQIEAVEPALRIRGRDRDGDGRARSGPRRGRNFETGNFDEALIVLGDQPGGDAGSADGSDVIFDCLESARSAEPVSAVFLRFKVLPPPQVERRVRGERLGAISFIEAVIVGVEAKARKELARCHMIRLGYSPLRVNSDDQPVFDCEVASAAV